MGFDCGNIVHIRLERESQGTYLFVCGAHGLKIGSKAFPIVPQTHAYAVGVGDNPVQVIHR